MGAIGDPGLKDPSPPICNRIKLNKSYFGVAKIESKLGLTSKWCQKDRNRYLWNLQLLFEPVYKHFFHEQRKHTRGDTVCPPPLQPFLGLKEDYKHD